MSKIYCFKGFFILFVGCIFVIPAFTQSVFQACIDAPVSFTPDSMHAGDTYSWDFGDGTPIVTDQLPVHTFDATGTYTVVLTLTNADNCSNADSWLVHVNEVNIEKCGDPIVSLGYSAQSNAFLYSNVLTGLPPYTYLWSTGEVTDTIVVSPAFTTTYFLTVTDDLGCTAFDTFQVEVVDVRCGNSLDKVVMCDDQNGEKCVKQSDVFENLQLGWTLGSCNSTYDFTDITCGEPDFESCACVGGLSSIIFQYTGTSGVTIQAFSDNNQTTLLGTYPNVQSNDHFSVDGIQLVDEILENKTFLSIDGGPLLEFESKCGKILVGQQESDIYFSAYTDLEGGTCTQQQCECNGGISLLSVVYLGPNSDINIYENPDNEDLLFAFEGVLTGDTLLLNSELIGESSLPDELYFEAVSVGSEEVVLAGCGDVQPGDQFGLYEVSGYVDEDLIGCNLEIPSTFGCECEDGVLLISFVYSGPTGYDLNFYENTGQTDLLFTLTNVQNSDTILLDGRTIGLNKFPNEIFAHIPGSAEPEVEILTKCGDVAPGIISGYLETLGYADAEGNTCNQIIPTLSNCNCEAGVSEFSAVYLGMGPVDINVWADKNHNLLLFSFLGIENGDEMIIDAMAMTGGLFDKKVYFEIVGAALDDTELDTKCGKIEVGTIEDDIGILSYVDALKQSCEESAPISKVSSAADNGQGAGAASAVEVEKQKVSFNLYPNPFKTVTTAYFYFPRQDDVTLKLYDMKGNELKVLYEQEVVGRRDYKVEIDAVGLSQGIYIARLTATLSGNYTRRLVLVR